MFASFIGKHQNQVGLDITLKWNQLGSIRKLTLKNY